MIAYLKGKIIHRQAPNIIIDVNGVGYEVWVPMSTYYNIKQDIVELFCYQYIREDANTLYGFSDLLQKKLFVSLIKVNGVGPRLALTILSNYEVNEFISVIQGNNLNALVRLPGVGKKTAERLLLELKDNLNKIFKSDEILISRLNTANRAKSNDTVKNNLYLDKISNTEVIVADAIAALEALGYKYNEAHKVINKITSQDSLDVFESSESLIRAALKEFR